MLEMFSRWRTTVSSVLFLFLLTPAALVAQTHNQATPATPQAKEKAQPAEKPADKPRESVKTKLAKGKFNLKVTPGPLRTIDLKSNEASVAEIVAKLSKELEIPVLMSPVMQKARISVDFEGMPLEGAVLMMAPRPYADYEISGDGGTLTKMVALYLYALNEPPPSESAVVRGDSEAILISGEDRKSVV